ncbi:NAD-dependent epimerase/dehydratase family protein [Asticcacaulis taihuensis]|uniref:dTDP-L-rhamnose 4-epimerase n=1 Tax=Asticcacaulis taihuensis TaxID=260084 RepID=A0A1G4SE85_9CAUL|nr:NAD-dependent epimerase/dehydratase family protein [Asticcacaulis taihuensis]SCW67524.1 dTDP-L-rhamnose 4-epimerase [Asticcacaulis taihuensis]
MNVLITGGAGFIGSELGRRLAEEQGARIMAVDSLLEQVHPSGRPPAAFPDSAVLMHNDVRDRAAWDALFAEFTPDIIVHFAAETGTAQSLTESARHASVNATGTAEMLDALYRAGHRPKKILLSSSRAVYGEGAWQAQSGETFYPGRRSNRQLSAAQWDFIGPDGVTARALPHAGAKVLPNPTSIYGATKLSQEHILSSWCEAYDIPLSILRFQNVYGPGQSPLNPYTGIINIFHRQAYAKQPIQVYEDGQIGRDFVFIDDVVTACVAALGNDAVTLADIGFGKVTTIHDAARIIAQIHGAPEPEVCGKFRNGDVRWAVADVAEMKEGLGVAPTVDFEEGARRVGQWLKETGNIG